MKLLDHYKREKLDDAPTYDDGFKLDEKRKSKELSNFNDKWQWDNNLTFSKTVKSSERNKRDATPIFNNLHKFNHTGKQEKSVTLGEPPKSCEKEKTDEIPEFGDFEKTDEKGNPGENPMFSEDSKAAEREKEKLNKSPKFNDSANK
jgi:hypothetical protein